MFDKLFNVLNKIEPEVPSVKAATIKQTESPARSNSIPDMGTLIGADPFVKKIEGVTQSDRIKQKMELLKKLQEELESMK